MYIRNIKLQNYRNYEHLDLDLGKKTTVLIGKNGMGKTNLVTAIKQSISFIFRQEKGTPQYDFIRSLDQKVKSFEPLDPHWGFNGTELDYCFPVSISAEMIMRDGNSLIWELTKPTRNKGLTESLYSKQANEFWKYYPDFQNLPIFAFFSDTYPHVKAVIGKNKKNQLKSGNPFPRNESYFKWDEYLNCDNIWMNYFTTNYKNVRLGSSKGNVKYVDAIIDCLVDFSRPLKDSYENNDITIEKIGLEARDSDYVATLTFADGHTTSFDMLPMGLRRIFSIVFDIANRSYILNQNIEPEGIVFIDEVDLHLHPSLSQEILDRLHRTFPNMQFIVTTHSPLVLSNVKQDSDNIVYKLYKNESLGTEYVRLNYTYGIDYNNLLVDAMESPVRNSLLRKLMETYEYWDTAGQNEFKAEILKQIVELVGTDSNIVKGLQKQTK